MSLSVNPKSNSQSINTNFSIEEELNRLEEIILDSPRIPLSGKTMIEEEVILDQLDYIRTNLPDAFARAQEIIRQQDEILLKAQEDGRRIVEISEQQSAQILDQSGIIRQAEAQSQQLMFQTKQECDARLRQTITETENIRRSVEQECQEKLRQTIAESENIRLNATRELERYQQQVMAESDEKKAGADNYASDVLSQIERYLTNLSEHFGHQIRVVREGREELYNSSTYLQQKYSHEDEQD
jgi:hypothetical protein